MPPGTAVSEYVGYQNMRGAVRLKVSHEVWGPTNRGPMMQRIRDSGSNSVNTVKISDLQVPFLLLGVQMDSWYINILLFL